MVLSKDVKTGETLYKSVLTVYRKSTKKLIKLNIQGEEIRTTPSHLFFVDGWWKTAEHLEVGDEILTSSGELKEVTSIEVENLTSPERIYNLNVEGYHTYFVGSEGLLVHNYCGQAAISDSEAISEGITDVTEVEAITMGRPSWRKSEIDAAKDFPSSKGYSDQVSFKKDADGNIVEASYGEAGSIRPDYYKSGHSVDIKNYNVTTSSGRSSLIRNIRKQYWQMKDFFGEGTKQTYMLDVRGQNVTDDVLLDLQNAIYNETDTLVEIIIKQY